MLKIPKLILLKFWNLATQSLDALDPITTKIYLFTHCVWINCIIFVDSRLAPYLINSISLQNLSLVSDSFCGKTLASRSWGFYFLPQVSHPVKTLLKLTFCFARYGKYKVQLTINSLPNQVITALELMTKTYKLRTIIFHI